MEQKINLKALLPLNEAVLHILLELFEPQEIGRILKTNEEKGNRRLKMSLPQLESILQKLQSQHLVVKITSNKVSENHEPQYVITPLGKEVVQLELKRLKQWVQKVEKVLRNEAKHSVVSSKTQH